jgi:hypothetical protein
LRVHSSADLEKIEFANRTVGIELRCEDSETSGTGERGGTSLRVVDRKAVVRLNNDEIRKLVEFALSERIVELQVVAPGPEGEHGD